MRDAINELLDGASIFAKRLWLVAKHRPFFRCPFCKGAGGEVSGYYEPEWSECRACYDHYEALEDHGWPWFVGRLPLLRWIRAKASLRAGLWYVGNITDIMRCGLGWHQWHRPFEDENVTICQCCYEPKLPTENT